MTDAEPQEQSESANSTWCLKQDQCKKFVVDEDLVLPSKTCFQVETTTDLVWQLNYCYDSFKEHGESRPLFKWYQYVYKATKESGLWTNDNSESFIFHFRSPRSPHGYLADSVCSTVAILSFFFTYVQTGRIGGLVNFVNDWVASICDRTVANFEGDFVISEESVFPQVRVLSGGVVSGLIRSLGGLHKVVLQAWLSQWSSMHSTGLLTLPLIAHNVGEEDRFVLLKDLVQFALLANRTRKAARLNTWHEERPIGKYLLQLTRGLIKFLAARLEEIVRGQIIKDDIHEIVRVAPARRLSGSDSTKRRSTFMSVEAIWEVLQTMQDEGVSTRDTLRAHKNPRLSKVGGSNENAQDSWVRKLASMYDDNVMYSLAGCNHLNLVSDCSTHAGKEILVSLIWSQENQVGAFSNLQQILPGTVVTPNELELTPVVEILAKARTSIELK